MPEDQTTMIQRDENKTSFQEANQHAVNGSSIGRVSIRAWLALIITITICANWTTNMIMATLGYTSVNIVIPEPLYSAFTMVLGIYFGQQLKK